MPSEHTQNLSLLQKLATRLIYNSNWVFLRREAMTHLINPFTLSCWVHMGLTTCCRSKVRSPCLNRQKFMLTQECGTTYKPFILLYWCLLVGWWESWNKQEATCTMELLGMPSARQMPLDVESLSNFNLQLEEILRIFSSVFLYSV